jgi:hypothetical protein
MQKQFTIQGKEYMAKVRLHRPEELRLNTYSSIAYGLDHIKGNLANITKKYSDMKQFTISFEPTSPEQVSYISYIMNGQKTDNHNGLVFTANKNTALYYTIEGYVNYEGKCTLKTYKPYILIDTKGHAKGYDACLSDSMHAKLVEALAPVEQWIADNLAVLQESELAEHLLTFEKEINEQLVHIANLSTYLSVWNKSDRNNEILGAVS